MNDDQRTQVRDNARYLRNVRPIDPEELYEYVEGQPHPAAVRQVLREQAFELELIEQDDVFVPVPEKPVEVPFDGVSVPTEHTERLDALLCERFGADWSTGESGEQLREIIVQIKDDYLHQRPVEYDRDTALAYAIYHLYDNYAVIQHALMELIRGNLVDHRLRVLDIGAGVGGPALGLLDLLEPCLIDYHAVEPSAAASVFESLVAPGRNQSVTVHRTRAEAFEPAAEYDLVLFANVLSELNDPVSTVDRYLDALTPDGTCLLLAPADRNTATGLRETERTLADELGYTVYAPTVRLWPELTPSSRAEAWSFDVEPDVSVPSVQRRLADAASETAETDASAFINTDVQYAYSMLRRDDRQQVTITPDSSRFTPMADTETHVSDRIDLLSVKLSHDLGGEHPLFLIGDGSQQIDHFAVLVHETGLNDALIHTPYGGLLAFENALVLWNDDESAYNLVVDGETVVDRLA
ncbi:methyltransferase domain-containing protein [Halocatena pleomorpha]|uniref:Class I SAM-dependent methyltransferase n=1 Tax=Halocatena pleomorpha TaxID=1785090 RepID=A0A3P3RJF8_9EURY|nr:class I SAM-dependent methyltransferase [Halocatena pleomorpha]RRJ33641.1 class I SAM-dependent methyltransferase [Halocatena pleomorpha]